MATQPDLTVVHIQYVPELYKGGDFQFYYRIQNWGTNTPGFGSEVIGYTVASIDATYNMIATDDLIHIDSNGSLTSSWHHYDTSNLSVGIHTLYIKTDNWNNVSESDENNNMFSVNFTVLDNPPADLTSSLSVDSYSVTQGDNLSIHPVINNIGGTNSSASSMGIYLDNNRIITDDAIGIIGSVSGYWYWNPSYTLNTANWSVGEHTLYVKANDSGAVTESNPDNNVSNSITITVNAPPHINQAPIVGTPMQYEATENQFFSYTIPTDAFSDPDGDSLSYTVSNKPDWLSFDGNNTFTGTAPIGSPDATISITASDPSGAYSVPNVFTITIVTPAPVNNPHTGTVAIDDTTPKVNQDLSVIDSLADADGLGTRSYEWLIDNAVVGNGNTYAVADNAIGKAISVRASYTDGKGFFEVANSDATSAVSQATVATYNGNQYFLSHAATWTEAEAEAVTKGGHLVTINDQAEQDWLVSTFLEKQHLWIGLTDQETEGSFNWINGENSAYRNWISGQPDNYWTSVNNGVGEDYVHLNPDANGQWNDLRNDDFSMQGIIEIGNHAPTGVVTINDTTPKQNQVLTASNNLIDSEGLSTITYTWFANDVATNTGNNHIVSSDEIGKTIKVTASYTDGWGKTESVSSDSTSSVIAVNNPDSTDPFSLSWSAQVVSSNNYQEDPENITSVVDSGILYVHPALAYVGNYWTQQKLAFPTTFDGDNFKIEARIKNPSSEGGITAYDFGMVAGLSTLPKEFLTGKFGTHLMGESWAVSYTNVYAGESSQSGISELVKPLDDWHTVSVETKNQNVIVSYDGVVIKEYGYSGTVGLIDNINLSFKGSGSIDWAKVYSHGQMIINDDFNAYSTRLLISVPTIGNDTLPGTTGDDSISALAGDDSISGLEGNDIIDGGLGTDTMIGGTGNDSYTVDNIGDRVIETSTLVTEIDSVTSSISYTLPTNVENLFLSLESTDINALNATGNNQNNTLIGNGLANTLDGGRGVDIMDGGDGNDTYIVDNINDVVTEEWGDAQAGVDTVRSYVSYSLGDNIENLTLIGTGTAKIKAIGNALNNTLIGNSAANNLIGNAGADKLMGGAGNDVLNGGGNNLLKGGISKDNLTGGLGADTFKFNKVSESGITATTRDTITDFKHAQADKIDLSLIDANTTVTGNNSFSFNEGSHFSGSFANSGSLYFDQTTHILYGNNDSDSTADFSILLTGVTSLTANDFIL